MRKFFIFLFIIHLNLFFIMPINAYAYIDPGTGSLILQALAAAAFSVLAFWRGLREKVMSFFNKNKDKTNSNDSK